MALPPAPKNWFITAHNAAVAALPERLYTFVTTREATYASNYLPVIRGEEQWLLKAYCDGTYDRTVPEMHYIINAPILLLWIHYPTGEFRWEEPTPSAYGLPTASQTEAGLRLGVIERKHLPGISWGEASNKYFHLVRHVIEQGWLVQAYPVTAQERETAQALRECIRICYDAPLIPFYQHFGHHFLAWIERASK